ncbi:tyrosine-type recombinase/integrase [Effusibacillus pohliae]|uniref:tyrosine-type recombinase/integrase n=1 Tax=Effusibacillus pohliae TaxID=232270 RepID=UPI001FE23728|nr:tyrosine-type recombinase/integrase [Effusibacillus pohliae]
MFYKQAQRTSETTLNDYRGYVERFFKRFPDSWQSPNLKKCAMEYMADNVKPATFNLRLTYLRAFFGWCVEEGYLSENPLAGIKRVKAEPRIVEIPEDMLQALLALPDQSTFSGLRDYALLLFTLDTGVRPKEAFSLTVEDFDLSHHVVTIPADVAKTRTARTLPIMPQTADAIRKLIRVRPADWGKDVPVFCSSEGTPLTRHTWRDRLRMYSKQLGFKIRPYDLRHTFALMYLRNEGNAFALQRMMGHSDMSMTKTYVHLTGQDLRETHKKASPLNSLIPKKKTRVRKIDSRRK